MICLAAAGWILLVGTTGGTIATAIVLVVLVLTGVAMARKRKATVGSDNNSL